MQQLKNNFVIFTMIDVGQGDGFKIAMPGGQTIYIDLGDDFEKIRNQSDIMNKNFLDKIFNRKTADIVILTHDDADHAGAFPEFARQNKIGIVGISPFQYTYMDKAEKESEFKKINLIAGMKINLSANQFKKDLKNEISILYPDLPKIESVDTSKIRADNSSSLIFKYQFGSTSILFTGDAGIKEENLLFKQDLQSDILKIGHHGSKNSTGEEFLQSVNPYLALISVGLKNKYGHPAKTTIEKLEAKDIGVIRTDRCSTMPIYIYKSGAIGHRHCI